MARKQRAEELSVAAAARVAALDTRVASELAALPSGLTCFTGHPLALRDTPDAWCCGVCAVNGWGAYSTLAGTAAGAAAYQRRLRCDACAFDCCNACAVRRADATKVRATAARSLVVVVATFCCAIQLAQRFAAAARSAPAIETAP